MKVVTWNCYDCNTELSLDQALRNGGVQVQLYQDHPERDHLVIKCWSCGWVNNCQAALTDVAAAVAYSDTLVNDQSRPSVQQLAAWQRGPRRTRTGKARLATISANGP
ncbi:hypothetical protein KY386_02430 [Candidatus Parcubacteria bacterium]|nr:hypothetical protein [Candidatus Parcubacteria bacterium]